MRKRKAYNLSNYLTTPTKRRQSVINTVKDKKEKISPTKVVIPYRIDGEGKGAYYDHQTLQYHTHCETVVSSYRHTDANGMANRKQLSYFINRDVMHEIAFGEKDSFGSTIPVECIESDVQNGLLFIPGSARHEYDGKTPDYRARVKHQTALMKAARLRGQPILAVCGGAWAVWEHWAKQPGQTKNPPKNLLIKATSHSYRGGMPRPNMKTGKVSHNKQVHRIKFTNQANLLKAAMRYNEFQQRNPYPSVNSVHWQAPNHEVDVPGMVISAYAVADDKLVKQNKLAETVEAFETAYGAPVLGLQWHPEAYFSTITKAKYFPQQHNALLRYMSQAGVTYTSRCRLVNEFKTSLRKHNGDIKQFKRTELKRAHQWIGIKRKRAPYFYLTHQQDFRRIKLWKRRFHHDDEKKAARCKKKRRLNKEGMITLFKTHYLSELSKHVHKEIAEHGIHVDTEQLERVLKSHVLQLPRMLEQKNKLTKLLINILLTEKTQVNSASVIDVPRFILALELALNRLMRPNPKSQLVLQHGVFSPTNHDEESSSTNTSGAANVDESGVSTGECLMDLKTGC